MALNDAYFDSINIDVAKKKYYNANKVEAVLQNIRREVGAMNEENARLRQEVERMTAEKRSVGDALISARALAQQIISEANAQAEDIVRDAQEQRQRILDETGDVDSIIAAAQKKADVIMRDAQEEKRLILDETRDQQEYTAQYVQKVFGDLKEQQLQAAKHFDFLYQQFLCGLYGETASGEETETDEADDINVLEPLPPPPTDMPTSEEPEPDKYDIPGVMPIPEGLAELDELLDPVEDDNPLRVSDDDIPGLETVPEDLKDKVSAIAKALLELEDM